MNKLVFSVFVLSLGLLIGAPGCRKRHEFRSEGVIVGWNDGACSTCGGFYVNISADTVKDSSSYYVLNYSDALTSVIVQYSTQYHQDRSPIYISFDWQPVSLNDPGAPSNWIRVTAIRSR
jgi:hypothetical protein